MRLSACTYVAGRQIVGLYRRRTCMILLRHVNFSAFRLRLQYSQIFLLPFCSPFTMQRKTRKSVGEMTTILLFGSHCRCNCNCGPWPQHDGMRYFWGLKPFPVGTMRWNFETAFLECTWNWRGEMPTGKGRWLEWLGGET